MPVQMQWINRPSYLWHNYWQQAKVTDIPLGILVLDIYITPPGKFSWISKLIQEHEIIVLASSHILLGLHASLCTPSSAPTREWLPYQLLISIYNCYQNCHQLCGSFLGWDWNSLLFDTLNVRVDYASKCLMFTNIWIALILTPCPYYVVKINTAHVTG